jgi:glucose/arabinose dehydrogenase
VSTKLIILVITLIRYLKDRTSVGSALPIFCALLAVVSIMVLSQYDNKTLLSKVVQSATAISIAYSGSHGTDAITKIQLPGIIPNDNNPPPLSSSPSSPPTITTPLPPKIRNTRAPPAITGPTLNDPNLKVEQIINKAFDDPTSMAFLGLNDILVLEKNTGKVHRILNGKILPQPLLDVNVASEAERGLLGIAIAKNDNASTENGNTRHIFLYYTESGGGKDGDDAPNNNITETTSGIAPAGNRLYRYDPLASNNNNNIKLTNPKLVLNLPASPPPGREGTEKNHNGGKVLIGPDNNVYVGIGDVAGHRGQAENNPNGIAPDGTGGILRITQDGHIVDNPPLGDNIPLALYYAYGMRNTFGMDFDPITGNLWDTENGNTFGDEINLVHRGFNSGWSQVAGIWEAGSKPGPAIGADSNNPPKSLVTFGGRGVYRAPEFALFETIAPTAIKFLSSDKLGKQYENTIFMGDVNLGNLYNFKLNEDRTGLVLDGPLVDKVANAPVEMQQGGIILGQGFGVITDLQVGSDDGYLYILTLQGSIYRIVPSS